MGKFAYEPIKRSIEQVLKAAESLPDHAKMWPFPKKGKAAIEHIKKSEEISREKINDAIRMWLTGQGWPTLTYEEWYMLHARLRWTMHILQMLQSAPLFPSREKYSLLYWCAFQTWETYGVVAWEIEVTDNCNWYDAGFHDARETSFGA